MTFETSLNSFEAQAITFVKPVGQIGFNVPTQWSQKLEKDRGGGDAIDIVIAEDGDTLAPFAGDEETLDGAVHTGQEERIEHVLEARLKVGVGWSGLLQAAVYEALGKERRDAEFLGKAGGEQWLCRRERPTELHWGKAKG